MGNVGLRRARKDRRGSACLETRSRLTLPNSGIGFGPMSSHEAAWYSAAPGASIAAGGGHGLHSLQRPQWKRDTFPISPEAHEISVTELMKLHFIQIHLARRLS